MKVAINRITQLNTQLIDELTQIEADAFGEGGLNSWTFPVCIRHGAVYVLKCNDAICGVADVIRDWLDHELAFIVGFTITKSERGKGLGSIFLRELVEEFRSEGIKRVQLTVDSGNEQAVRLYQNAGFKPVAELPDEYGPAVDRILYELELEE